MFEGITFTPELPPIDQLFKSSTVVETLCIGHYIHVDAYGYIVWVGTGRSLHNTSNANPFTNLQRAVLFIQAYQECLKSGDQAVVDDCLLKHQIKAETDREPPAVLLPDDNELYRFREPHCTGGDAVVTLTRRQAIEWQREAIKKLSDEEDYRYPADLSDETMIKEFVAVLWAWRVKEEKIEVTKAS